MWAAGCSIPGIQNHSTKNEMNRFFKSIHPSYLLAGAFLTLIAGLVFSAAAFAGTVNVNFTNTSPTGFPAADGTGILGGGGWGRFNTAQATTSFNFQSSTGAASGVSIVNNAIPFGDSQGNGNPVQNESWFTLSGLSLTISGLVANGSYQLACYSDVDGFLGFVSPTTLYTANGVSATTTNGTASPRSLPGTRGIDYALITTKANAAGQIVLTGAQIAGLQIQGVFVGERGPKMDCMIARSAGSRAGKGRGIFGIAPNPAQSLSQSGAGGTARTYFVNVRNTGAEFDRAFLMAFPDRGASIRVIDQTTRKNVTAASIARRHRFNISAGATSRFTVQVSSLGPQTRALNVGIGASPSTLRRPQQDVVTCVLTP
jgi:hypothetical protein